MRRWLAIGLTLAVLWLFINGATVTPAGISSAFLVGLAISLPVAYAFRRFYTEDIHLRNGLATIPFGVLYILLFLAELLTANVDVARRVLSPSMPIEPDVVEVPLRVRSDLAVTTIANSITLTPGTLTMDYNEDRNTLYVHGITGANRDAVVGPIRSWEDYALIVFDEKLDPSDPVPDPDARGADPGGETDGE